MSDPVILSLKYTASQQDIIDVNHLLPLAEYIRGDFLDHDPDFHEVLLANFLKFDYVYPIAYFESLTRTIVSGSKEKLLRKPSSRKSPEIIGESISKYPLVISPKVKPVFAIDIRQDTGKYKIIRAGKGERLRVKYLTIRDPGIYENGVYVTNDYLASLSGKIYDCLDKELILKLFYAFRVISRYAGTYGAMERADRIYDDSALISLHDANREKLEKLVHPTEKLITIPQMNYLSEMGIHANQSPIGLFSLYSALDRESMLIPYLRGDKSHLQNYLFRLNSANLQRKISNEKVMAHIKFGSYVRICKALNIPHSRRATNMVEFVNSVMALSRSFTNDTESGRKNLSALEYHYGLELAEIEVAKNNLCSHIIGLRKVKSRPELWEQYKKKYLGEKMESYYLCQECGVSLICPHMVDFYESKPISKYYEGTIEGSGVYVCKICREILVDGASGTDLTIINGYDRELDDLIWRDLQSVKRSVNFRKIADLRGQSRFLDRTVIDKLYPALYEINTTMSRIKSINKNILNHRQSFYNQAHILLYFVRMEYEVSLNADFRKPDYRLKDRISMADIVRYLSMTNKDSLQFMNAGDAQIQAIVTEAGKNIMKLMHGEEPLIMNHVMIAINILPIMKLILHGSTNYSKPIMKAWTDAECRRVFGFPLNEMNHRNYLEPILKLEDDEGFNRLVSSSSVMARPWIRMYRTIVLNTIDINKRVRDSVTLDFEKLYPVHLKEISEGMKYSSDGLIRDPDIPDSEVQEYIKARSTIRAESAANRVRRFMTWEFNPWSWYKPAIVNLFVNFDKSGNRRKWTGLVYSANNSEIVLSNSDWDKRPPGSKIIDYVDSTGARRSELLEEPYDLSRDWKASIKNGFPTVGFASEISVEVHEAITKKLMKVEFIQSELRKAEQEGRTPNMEELTSDKYFAKHFKNFNKPKTRVFKSREIKKENRIVAKYEKDMSDNLGGLISSLSSIYETHHSYLWELGNLRNRQYRDIPDEWSKDSGATASGEVIPARKPQNRYSSYRMSALRSYYYLIIQTLEKFKYGPEKIARSRVYDLDLKSAVALGANSPEISTDDLKFMDPFILDTIDLDESKKQINGIMYALYSKISELHKSVPKIIDPLFRYILQIDADNCAPDIKANVELAGFLRIRDDELEADASLESVEDEGESEYPPEMDYFDFLVEDGLEVNLEP